MPKTPSEEIDVKAGESNLLPILDHVAWLAERVADKANAGRAYDAALLTYNAAVMLEWRFRFPLGDWAVPPDSPRWAEAAKLVDDLSMSSRAIVEKVEAAPKKKADAYRPKLRMLIKRVLKKLPAVLSVRTPKPAYMPALDWTSFWTPIGTSTPTRSRKDWLPARQKAWARRRPSVKPSRASCTSTRRKVW